MNDNFGGLVLGERYAIQTQQSGVGRTAIVFKGRDRNLERDVAIKIVKAEYTLPPDAKDFLAKAHSITELHHPHILRIYDYGIETIDDTPRFYLVMPYAQGGTLRKRGALSADQAERIMRDVSAALDYAHRRGVLHLDLHPDNILFDDQGNVMVADFGLTRLIQETARPGVGMDAVAQDYAAPEQLSGDPICPSTDIYALGVLLRQMLTGELSNAVQAVIEVATRPDPQQRYRTAGELASALTTALHPFPAHIIAVREALCQLGQLCEDKTRLNGGQIATYASTQTRLLSALGYGEPGKKKYLERRQDGIVLHPHEKRASAIVVFVAPGSSLEKGLTQLEQIRIADRPPNIGAVCNGCELWLHHRTETGFYPRPTKRLSLKDTTDVDAQTVYEWLGRHEMEKTPINRHVPAWLAVGRLAILIVLLGLFLFGVERGLPEGQGPVPLTVLPTGLPSPTFEPLLSATPISTFTPFPTPTDTPSPTATPVFYLMVRDEQANVYAGPGENYDVLAQVRRGYKLRILGRSENGRWWQVDHLGWPGWVAAQSVATDVDIRALPAVKAPPPSINHPPDIQAVEMASTVETWNAISVTCVASDQDDDALTYIWEASGGSVAGNGSVATYRAPEVIGVQTITVTVRDEHGKQKNQFVQVQIIPVQPPTGKFEPASVFGQIWHRYAATQLGWAIEEERGTPGARQLFDHGLMFWRKDTVEIYVLMNDRDWQAYPDIWKEDMDEYSCSDIAERKTPPTPIRGFGKVWCGLGGPNAEIGWASDDEQGYPALWQSFEHGVMCQGPDGAIYILYEDNSWQSYQYPFVGEAPNCTGAPTQRIQVSDTVQVCTAYDRLVVHTEPRYASPEVARLDPGVYATVVDGPACVDGRLWWKIRADSGTVGWVTEGGDEIDPYFICPIVE